MLLLNTTFNNIMDSEMQSPLIPIALQVHKYFKLFSQQQVSKKVYVNLISQQFEYYFITLFGIKKVIFLGRSLKESSGRDRDNRKKFCFRVGIL